MSANEDMLAVSLTVGQAVTLWTVLTPSFSEVRRHDPRHAPDFAEDVRMAELVAGSLAITIGGIMSVATHNNRPVVIASVVVCALVIAYEFTLRRPGARGNVVSMREETVQ